LQTDIEVYNFRTVRQDVPVKSQAARKRETRVVSCKEMPVISAGEMQLSKEEE